MKVALALPILLPLVFAAALAAWRPGVRLQRAVGVGGAAAQLACAGWLFSAVARDGIQVARIGGWPAPYGIVFVADVFSSAMTAVAAVIGLAVAVYSIEMTEDDDVASGFYPLLHVLLAGVSGAFLTGDLFNLYVWFEVMLVSSFVLMTLGRSRAQMEGSIKYFVLNLLSSALFLSAAGILYGMTGTLNMADLARSLAAAGPSPQLASVSCLLLVAFGIKAAMFPLYFWLPASYHTPSAAVSAVFAGLLTKVGVYALVRVFTLLFPGPGYARELLLWASALTMLSGVLGAVVQTDFRRILSFHIISQIGYMLFGLALDTRLALTGMAFYVVHHIVVKTNLFLISGAVAKMAGGYELAGLGGLQLDRPGWTAAFLVSALSLAGLPPLSGFFAKLSLLQAGLASGAGPQVGVALLVGLLTLMSMTKILSEAFWRPAARRRALVPVGGAAAAPVAALALLTAALSLGAGGALRLADRAAAEFQDPAGYSRAVLGDAR